MADRLEDIRLTLARAEMDLTPGWAQQYRSDVRWLVDELDLVREQTMVQQEELDLVRRKLAELESLADQWRERAVIAKDALRRAVARADNLERTAVELQTQLLGTGMRGGRPWFPPVTIRITGDWEPSVGFLAMLYEPVPGRVQHWGNTPREAFLLACGEAAALQCWARGEDTHHAATRRSVR